VALSDYPTYTDDQVVEHIREPLGRILPQFAVARALQSFTDPHLRDAQGYAVTANTLMNCVEPRERVWTIGIRLLEGEDAWMAEACRRWRKARDAASELALQQGMTPSSRLSGAAWLDIATGLVCSVPHARRLVRDGIARMAELLGCAPERLWVSRQANPDEQ
jgi:hypothetical protein